MSSHWAPVSILTANTFQALMSGDVPFIRLGGFLSGSACRALTQRFKECRVDPYRGIDTMIERVGMTVFEHDRAHERAQYFDTVQAVKLQRDTITTGLLDPLTAVLGLLRRSLGREVNIAVNDDGEEYYAEQLRRIRAGTELHIDYAPSEHPTWEVARVHGQLSWNVFLDGPLDGTGSTTIYRRAWSPEDDVHRDPAGYGFAHALIEGCEAATYAPVPGDLVLINTRHYHEVAPSSADRIAATSAGGVMPNGSVVLWS